MRYYIWGEPMPAVTIGLSRGESVFTQSGGMAWMTDRIEMTTNMRGGFMKGLGRMFAGESLFIATYTAHGDEQEITFASSMPGEIRVFEIMPGREIIAQKGAFLCATPGVEIRNNITGVKAGVFGGEGMILQGFTGHGLVFVEMDGSIKEVDLQPGQTIKVDSGNVAAFENCVGYDVETVKGFKNVLFGGEGLFLTTLTGPGKVWLQTMPVCDLAKRIIPYIPTSDD